MFHKRPVQVLALALALSGCQERDPALETGEGDKAEGIGPGSNNAKDKAASDDPLDPSSGPSAPLPDSDPDHKPDLLNCDIDFLFVVDNSRSMASEQASLVTSVPKFVETLTQELDHEVDFHLGVITTDAYQGNDPKCRQKGAVVTQTAGKDSSNAQCGPFGQGGTRRYMDRSDNLSTAFPCAATPGTQGDGNETPMDAIAAALSPQMLGPGGCNEGFLRKEAILVTVLITDEDDHATILGTGSSGNPQSWKDGVMAIKDHDEQRVVVLGLVGQERPNDCTDQGFGTPGVRLMEFIQKFGKRGFVGDVCSPDYDPFFEQALAILDLACEELEPPQ